MVNGRISDEEVEQNLNFIERMLDGLSAEDDYLKAILHNQKILTQSLAGMDTTGSVDSTGVPAGTAGLSIGSISEGDVGTVLFKLDGRTVLSEFRAGSEVGPDEVVRVSANDGKVYPVSDVDPSKLDFGEISFASSLSTSFIFEETDDNVTIQPGGEEVVLKVNVDGPRAWHEIGTNDETYSLYQYRIDGDNLLHEPMKKPLGLYNNRYKFPEPIKVTDTLEVVVKRQADASSPQEYFSNAILM